MLCGRATITSFGSFRVSLLLHWTRTVTLHHWQVINIQDFIEMKTSYNLLISCTNLKICPVSKVSMTLILNHISSPKYLNRAWVTQNQTWMSQLAQVLASSVTRKQHWLNKKPLLVPSKSVKRIYKRRHSCLEMLKRHCQFSWDTLENFIWSIRSLHVQMEL